MREIPVQVLLSFPLPNYRNPRTRGPALLYINGILIGFTIVFVILRVYTRLFIKRWMGADDCLILVATVFAIGLTTCVVLANEKYYWDRHIWDVPFNKIEKLGQIAMAAKVLFSFATFFTRASLLSFYYRLLQDTNLRTYKLVLHLASIFNVIVVIFFVVLAIFQCRPIAAYWTFPASGKCMDEGKLTLACGVINCFLDLLITTLPIPMIMMLQMRLRQRVGVVILLSLGFVVTIAGIVRTYFIWKSLVLSYDETWFAYPLWIAAAVEVDLAVMCACAPAIRPILLKYFRPLVTSLSGSRSSHSRKTGNGYVSTHSEPSSRNYVSTEAEFDEKISAIETVRDDGKTPTVKLSLAKTPHDGKLQILHRVSWEVDYEDQTKLHNRVQENECDIGVAFSCPREARQSGKGRTRPQSVDILEALKRYDKKRPPRLQLKETNSPVALTETDPSSLDSRRSRSEAAVRDDETFWRSDSSDSTRNSTKSDNVPELQDGGERRWNIQRNPFRDGQQVSPISPMSGTYEGARAIEMKAFPRTKSPSMKVLPNGG